MLIQASAGQAPIECSIAVEKFSNTILQEVNGSKIISARKDYSGNEYKSCIIRFIS